MDCTFSNPTTYDGNIPTTTLDSFQFTKMNCATPSGQLQATTGGIMDYGTATNQAINGTMYVFYYFMITVILLMAIQLAFNFYKR